MKINLREGEENSDVLTIMIHISCLRFIVVNPSLLHHWSIAAPSHLHRNDGLSMDYRWTIDGLSAKEERNKSEDRCWWEILRVVSDRQ